MKRATRLMLVVALIAASVSVVMAGRGKGKGGGGGGTTTALSAAEKDGLVVLREEEKLARDVYLKLAEKWDLPIFTNIAASEQRHMDAVKNLIDKYGLEDPVKDNTIGKFTNTAFADLYTQLVDRGNESLADALQVGVFIEKLDIDDIALLLEDVTHRDIERVYTNLLAGSNNHLAAFNAALAAL